MNRVGCFRHLRRSSDLPGVGDIVPVEVEFVAAFGVQDEDEPLAVELEVVWLELGATVTGEPSVNCSFTFAPAPTGAIRVCKVSLSPPPNAAVAAFSWGTNGTPWFVPGSSAELMNLERVLESFGRRYEVRMQGFRHPSPRALLPEALFKGIRDATSGEQALDLVNRLVFDEEEVVVYFDNEKAATIFCAWALEVGVVRASSSLVVPGVWEKRGSDTWCREVGDLTVSRGPDPSGPFLVASGGVWVEGRYASEEAALLAARMPPVKLAAAWATWGPAMLTFEQLVVALSEP